MRSTYSNAEFPSSHVNIPLVPRGPQNPRLLSLQMDKFTIINPPEVNITTHPTEFILTRELRATNCHSNSGSLSSRALFQSWPHVPAKLVFIFDLAMNIGCFPLAIMPCECFVGFAERVCLHLRTGGRSCGGYGGDSGEYVLSGV